MTAHDIYGQRWLAVVFSAALAVGCPTEPEQDADKAAEGDFQAEMQSVEDLSRVEGELRETEIRYGELAAAWRDETGEDLATEDLVEADADLIREMIAAETQITRRSLLERLLRSRRALDDLRSQIETLRSQLPVADIVRPGDTHLALAKAFLVETAGLEAQAADAAAKKTALSEFLVPGMEVWHFWSDGLYVSAVTQGSAPESPWMLSRASIRRLEQARDSARGDALRYQNEAEELNARAESLSRERSELAQQHQELTSRHAAVTSAWEATMRENREMRYTVRSLRDLRRDGIVSQVSRKLLSFPDDQLERTQDPNIDPIIVLTADEVGLSRFYGVVLLPDGRFAEDVDYEVNLSSDRLSATLRVLRPERFAGEELLIAPR